MPSNHITWNAAPTADTYKVYRSTTAGQPGAAIAVGLTGLVFDDPTIVAGTTYFYSVSASNSVGEGPLSAQVSITTPTVPAAPTGLTVTYVP